MPVAERAAQGPEQAARGRRAVSVVVDTSAILCCVADGRCPAEAIEDALLSGVELLVPRGVVEELSRLAQSRGKRGALARAALSIVKRYAGESRLRIVEHREGDVDTVLLELTAATGGYLATADTELMDRARALGLPVLAYREAKRRFEPV